MKKLIAFLLFIILIIPIGIFYFITWVMGRPITISKKTEVSPGRFVYHDLKYRRFTRIN